MTRENHLILNMNRKFPAQMNHSIEVIKVKRRYEDVRTQAPITTRHPFIESPTHDATIVQVSKLQEPYQSEVEKLLAIFDQHHKAGFGREVRLDDETYPQPFRRVKERLLRAIADEPLRNQMDIEDDVLAALAENERELEEQDKKLEETTTALVQTVQALQAKDRALEQQGQQLAALTLMVEELQRAIHSSASP